MAVEEIHQRTERRKTGFQLKIIVLLVIIALAFWSWGFYVGHFRAEHYCNLWWEENCPEFALRNTFANQSWTGQKPALPNPANITYEYPLEDYAKENG